MRYILKICIIFVISLLLIFSMAACKRNITPDNSGSSENASVSSIITGSTDNSNDDTHLDINDIFGSSSSSSNDSSASSSSSSSSSGMSDTSNSSNSSDTTGSNSSTTSSGINYDDPNVWTDPM